MTARLASGVDGDPIRMRCLQVVISGVRVCAYQHRHTLLARSGDEFAKKIAVTEPCATVVEGNLSGIVGDATSAAKADTLGSRALEVVEPEGKVEVSWVVFDQGELKPSRGPRCPGGDGVGIFLQGCEAPKTAGRDLGDRGSGAGGRGGLQELPPGEDVWLHAGNGNGAIGRFANGCTGH